MGGKDLENGTIEIMRRDTLEKETRQFKGIVEYVEQLLEEVEHNRRLKEIVLDRTEEDCDL